jgi:hypothetical protein
VVRLAYLLVAGDPRTPKSKEVLTSFLVSLKRSLIERVISKLEKVKFTAVLTGFGVLCFLGMPCPPACVGMLSPAPIWGGIAAAAAGANYTAERGAEEIRKYMAQIQERFPILERLHDEVGKTFDNMKVLNKTPESDTRTANMSSSSSTDVFQFGFLSSRISKSASNRRQ